MTRAPVRFNLIYEWNPLFRYIYIDLHNVDIFFSFFFLHQKGEH